MSHWLRIVILTVLSLLLSSCMSIAMTGAGILYDNDELEGTFSNQVIKLNAESALSSDRRLFLQSNIVVAVFDHDLLLAGQTPNDALRRKALESVKKIPGVKNIYNGITIGANTTLLQRTSDMWITTKIKAKIVADHELDPDKIKVVTENGTVYLMATLQYPKAERLVKLTQATSGVKKVIKMLHYLERITI